MSSLVFILNVIDTISTMSLAMFGILNFMVWGMQIKTLQGIFEFVTTFGGMVEPTPILDYAFPLSVYGGIFALPVGVVNVRALVNGLSNEKPGSKAARQDLNTLTWIGWLIAFGLAYLDDTIEYATGTFGIAWLFQMIVLVVGNVLILQTNFTPLRKKLNDGLFKDGIFNNSNRFVDEWNGLIIMMYGSMMFLSAGVRLNIARNFLPNLMHMFGMLDGPDSIMSSTNWVGVGLDSLGCGTFSLGMAALNLSAFTSANMEDTDYATVRRYANLVFHIGHLVAFSNVGTGEGSSYFVFCTIVAITNVVMLERTIHANNNNSNVVKSKRG